MNSDSDRPESAYFLEAQRRMTGILLLEVRNSFGQVVERRWEARHTKPRISEWRDVSKVGTASFAQILKSLLGEFVQSPAGNILFELDVPGPGIEFGEPRAKGSQFLWLELRNGGLDLLQSAHGLSIRRFSSWVQAGFEDTGPSILMLPALDRVPIAECIVFGVAWLEACSAVALASSQQLVASLG